MSQSDDAGGTALSVQSVSVTNPRVVADSSSNSGTTSTWDCVWFGSYPQTEVPETDALRQASWTDGDATVDGVRYRRITRSDSIDPSTWPNEAGDYRYFRYEPIKWRVLNVSGSEALVVSDVALDNQRYNTEYVDITWEASSIRSWLNGYGSSSNQPGTDYSSNNFLGTAFSLDERDSILVTTVANANNTDNDMER